jgi:hypothetical protein
MEQATRKLLDVAGVPFLPAYTPTSLDDFEQFGEKSIEIRDILAIKNGFFCFEQALRFFPSDSTELSWGIHEWNDRNLWKYEYEGFAEEIFGNQFCIHDGNICVFNPETAEIDIICSTIEEWASKILQDYNMMTAYPLAHQWQVKYGRLPPRERLMPKTPFVVGGKYELANFTAVDSVRIMKDLGNLAHQIHDLPDGAQIRFVIL